MKTIKLSILLLALLTLGQATWAQNLIINSVDDWNTFAQSVTNGSTYTGQTVQLNTDITVSTMAGDENTSFAGTFDGQGHTITLNMTASMQFTSLICNADGATFQNLKVDGTINTSDKKFCAGFVGGVINHGCTFTNCVSDVTINSSISGDGTHGGLVAYVGKGDNTFEGCAFTGKLLGANTNYVGGLVGFTDSRNGATVSFTNCVFHPQQVTMSGNGSQTFARWYGNNSGSVTIGDNCYYSQTLGAAQGKQMRSITGGDYVTVAFSGNATTYERSGISAYSVGIVYGSTLYAGNGETVSLNLGCTPPTGYVCNGYTATAGTLTGTANPYTLTMPNETVTIQAVLVQSATPVSYMDGDGTEYTCNYYTVLTGGGATTLAEGWYVVDDDITYTGTLTLEGNVNLILCDGKTMMVNPDSGHSISGNALTIYGQTLDSVAAGTLYVINDVESKKAIDLSTYTQHSGNVIVNDSSDDAISASDFTLNGGTVNATCTGIHTGIWAGNVIINGGTVNANATEDWGIYSEGSVIINGGTVNATSEGGYGIYTQSSNVTINGGTVNATGLINGIHAQFDLILGWANANDHILVSSYSAPEGTVSVKSGQAFYYIDDYSGEPVIISGTLDEEQIEAIGGKTLFPYAPVAYIDENGVEQYCISYTVVTDNLNFGDLPAGWYVVSDSITLNSNVSFSGDAHLILCDGASMNISCDNDDALDCFGSLTLYGQSEGTGSLTAISTDDYDWSVGIGAVNLIINGSTVTATGSNYGIYADDLMTINGGTVNATSDQGIYVENYNVTINGGTVTTNGIYSPTVTLGWCDINDSITVGSFTYLSTFTVSVKSGQAFYYIDDYSGEPVIISGTLTTGEIAAISGKTLRPYIGPCAAPFNLEVTDIGTTSATLYWMGWTEQYEVMYEALGENVTREVSTGNNHSIVITDLTPNTTYEWKVRGVDCDGNGGNTEWSEMSFFTTPPISCYPVNSLSYDNLTSFSVNLNWILLDEAQTAWQICLNDDENNLIAANTNEGFLLDNLTPNVEYTVKVRAYCDENDYSSWSDTVTFTTPEVCFTPKNLAANNITAVSADLSWTGREDVESYTVRYRVTAERAGDWIIETTAETVAQLTGLDGGTTYEAQVRSDCNPDGWCNMITFTTLDENTKVFVFEGEWSDGNNWVPVGVPTIDNDVIIRANATVFDIAEANFITIDDAGALIIEDGGQLKTNSDVTATMKKFIIGYGTDNVETDNGYYLLALPTAAPIAASDAGLITEESDYDLYSWDKTAVDEEWHNNHDGIDLQNGVGFLYANQSDMEMIFTAMLRNSSEPVVVALPYDEVEFGGWNLYGNPFPCEAYLSTDDEGLTFYRLIGNDFIPITGTIAPMEGFFVVATAAGQTFTISREAPAKHVQP